MPFRKRAGPLVASDECAVRDLANMPRRIGGITRSVAQTLAGGKATGAAERLWLELRAGVGAFTFSRRRSIGGCPVDFVCKEIPLVIRIDGDNRAVYEARSTVILAECGYRVIRFWSDEVSLRLDEVLAEIRRQLELR